MNKLRLLGTAFSCVIFLTLPTSVIAASYTLIDLGTLGGTYSHGFGINDSGQVTGVSYTDSSGALTAKAFLYDGTTMHDLGTLGASWSHAYGINNSGQVVGVSSPAVVANRAFIHDGSTMHDLGTLGGSYSAGTDINDIGQAVGYSDITGDTANHAFLYDGSTMHDLGTLGGKSAIGYGINDSGQVVGRSSNVGDTDLLAFLYDGNTMHDLCILTDCTMNGWTSLLSAEGINNKGDITGYGSINGELHAFLVQAVPIPPALLLFGTGLLGLIGIARKHNPS